MGYSKKFKEHMKRSRKLADEIRAMGVNLDFNEKSGEITFKLSEIEKLKKAKKEVNDNG